MLYLAHSNQTNTPENRKTPLAVDRKADKRENTIDSIQLKRRGPQGRVNRKNVYQLEEVILSINQPTNHNNQIKEKAGPATSIEKTTTESTTLMTSYNLPDPFYTCAVHVCINSSEYTEAFMRAL